MHHLGSILHHLGSILHQSCINPGENAAAGRSAVGGWGVRGSPGAGSWGARGAPGGALNPHGIPLGFSETLVLVVFLQRGAPVGEQNSSGWHPDEFFPRQRGALNPPGALRAPLARPLGSRGRPRDPQGIHWGPTGIPRTPPGKTERDFPCSGWISKDS